MIRPRFLSPAQVCEIVPGLTEVTLKDMRSDGRGPAYYKPTGGRGRVTLYDENEVHAWIRASRVSPTEQP